MQNNDCEERQHGYIELSQELSTDAENREVKNRSMPNRTTKTLGPGNGAKAQAVIRLAGNSGPPIKEDQNASTKKKQSDRKPGGTDWTGRKILAVIAQTKAANGHESSPSSKPVGCFDIQGGDG